MINDELRCIDVETYRHDYHKSLNESIGIHTLNPLHATQCYVHSYISLTHLTFGISLQLPYILGGEPNQ